MRLLTTFALIFLALAAYPQRKTIPGINLYKAKVKSVTQDTTMIAGLEVKADKYIVKARLINTMRTGANPKFKKVNVKLAVYHLNDTDCRYLDAIYERLRVYWKGKEERANKYHTYNTDTTAVGYVVRGNDTIFFTNPSYGDFSNLPVNEGFFKSGDIIIPFISPDHRRVGTYEIFWFDQQVYKVVLLKTKGLGGMSFVGRNMRFTANDKEYPFEDYFTRQLQVMKEMLLEKNKIECSKL